MGNYSSPIYDKPREWVTLSRSKEWEWEDIYSIKGKDIEEFLVDQADINFWPEMSVKEWRDLVDLQKNAEDNIKNIDMLAGIAQIHDEGQDNAIKVPLDPSSSWQLYRNKLLTDGFDANTVDEIERTTRTILRRLNNDTRNVEPVKGLVIGNVQSGKTANMAALMAMAADWGWNMFIVLSGTIDNLRIQTQNRLFSDLNKQGLLWWRSLEHLSRNVDISQKAQNLHFDETSRERYFTVCLKNSSRLCKLIQWLQADKNKQGQMKILVIDDEADQASINTKNIENDEKNKINKLICALVNGKDENENDIDSKYMAMNYIGYTATPYANILNDASLESLYPKNFITTLGVSKEYFGPQQIFGYSGDGIEYEGLDIVRTISEDELKQLKEIHDSENNVAPSSLIDSICWFLCGVSCMRIWEYQKSISMLVHTSQKTAHHSEIANVITDWVINTPKEKIMKRIKTVWDRESTEFTVEKFREKYPDYGRTNEMIKQYPSFDLIALEINEILLGGVSNIKLDEDGDLTYHRGIHLCIDNCINNGITSDGMHVRLAYPDPKNMPDVAPAFIVIGGATLSRGLTIEGLISSYFLRSVGQADTLMQMGRWFGYRKNYELLPRIWMTVKTKSQFEFLAALDQELRDEIQYMDLNGRRPSDYGVKVKNSPKVSFIRITGKQKMQSATDSTMDYSGASNQTYLFDNDLNVLEDNINLTEEFLQNIGHEWDKGDLNTHSVNTAVWRNVEFELIRDYIAQFKFQDRMSVFNDTKPLLDWVKTNTDSGNLGKWNVIVAGKKNNGNGTWILPNGHIINKVSRSKKNLAHNNDNNIINIGVLREPSDVLADIDIGSIKNIEDRLEISDFIKSGIAKSVMAFRDKAGLETTPQLIIYRVDKDSRKNGKTTARADLNSKADLIGLCIYIPGGRIGTSYASTISIKMKNDIFDGDADLEDTDGN